MSYKTIAFTGTSLTSGQSSHDWQIDVMAALQAGTSYTLRHYNLGYPGRVVADGLADVGRVIAVRPDIAVIEYAMNDAYTANGISVETFKSSLEAIVDAIKSGSSETAIFLMTMNPAIAPGASTVPNLAQYYQGVRDTAALKGVGLIDNAPLWGTPSSSDIPDGIHPIQSAVRAILVPSVTAALRPLMA